MPVFDLSNPSQPVAVPKVELPFTPRALVQQDGLLLTSGGACREGGCSGGLVILDIADPTRPQQVAGLGADELGGFAYRVALDGDRLVIALGDAGLRIVDILDGENPVPLCILDLLVGDNYIGADWLATHGGYIYLMTSLPKGVESAKSYLAVVDAREPLNPVQANQFDLPPGSDRLQCISTVLIF